jgi:hypothetical protein
LFSTAYKLFFHAQKFLLFISIGLQTLLRKMEFFLKGIQIMAGANAAHMLSTPEVCFHQGTKKEGQPRGSCPSASQLGRRPA